jgi:hypothetical protein
VRAVDVSCLVAAVLQEAQELSTCTPDTLKAVEEAFLSGCPASSNADQHELIA